MVIKMWQTNKLKIHLEITTYNEINDMLIPLSAKLVLVLMASNTMNVNRLCPHERIIL